MSKPQPLSVSVTRVIKAQPQTTYDLVADVTQMGRFSPENTGATWLDGAKGPVVGAKFKGTNRLGSLKWATKPTVTVAERGETFAFVVPGKAKTTWTYQFEAVAEGVRVTESMRQLAPTPLPIRLMQRRAGVTDRAENLRTAMTTTLERLAAAAAADNRS